MDAPLVWLGALLIWLRAALGLLDGFLGLLDKPHELLGGRIDALERIEVLLCAPYEVVREVWGWGRVPAAPLNTGVMRWGQMELRVKN
jgi:hypothetical protein